MNADRSSAARPGGLGAPRTRRQVIAALSAVGSAAAVGALGWLGSSKGAGAPTTGTPSPIASPGSASPVASPVAGAQIVISNFSFNPASLTVPVGTEVVWTNQDDIPHTVSSADKTSFASDLLDTGDQFRHRFARAGTYPYFCALHPFMTAKIIVR